MSSSPDGPRIAVLTLASMACGLPGAATLRVELPGGCPTHFGLGAPEDAQLPALEECLRNQLFSTRWACATDTACVPIEPRTRP